MTKPLKILLLSSIVISSLIISSFTNGRVNGKIKTSISSQRGQYFDTINYNWDKRGRLFSIIRNPETYNYTYSGDTVFQFIVYKNADNNPAPKFWILSTDYKVTADNSGNKYYYNKNSLIVHTYDDSFSYSFTYSISDGDYISDTTTTLNKHVVSSNTYYPEVDFRDYGQTYLELPNRHLIRRQIISDLGHRPYDTVSYTYKMDVFGRPVSETTKSTSGGDFMFTFKYTDE